MMKWFFVNEPKKVDSMSSTVYLFNNTFKTFLTKGSWIVYGIAIILVVVSIYFFFIDQKKRRALLQRRREIRRANEKPPQKRRPGAACRNHEIYRSVMGKVQQYISPLNTETFLFRQTRSGTIYGQIVENQKEVEKEKEPLLEISQTIDEENKDTAEPSQ